MTFPFVRLTSEGLIDVKLLRQNYKLFQALLPRVRFHYVKRKVVGSLGPWVEIERNPEGNRKLGFWEAHQMKKEQTVQETYAQMNY